jgi:hypothetical protein
MLTILGRGVAGIALLNLVALVSLGVAYAWHDGIRLQLQHRRARQRAFARLLAQSTIGTASTMSEPNSAGDRWEW